jgi:HEAT repeat protein
LGIGTAASAPSARTPGDAPEESQRLARSALREALGDASADVRVCAARSLWKLSEAAEALEALRAALKDTNASVRLLAAQALDAIGPPAKVALKELEAAQNDTDEYVRRAATDAVRHLGAKTERTE